MMKKLISNIVSITNNNPKKWMLFFLFSFTTHYFSYSQNYNNPGGTINTCSGNFYDSGGSGNGVNANYNDNETITTTFCSNNGDCISANFTMLDIESGWDFLAVYDGTSVMSPLIGIYSGTISPGLITSTSGCLTFVFTSDGSFNYSGWEATLSCATCGAPPACTGTIPTCSSPPPDICNNACALGLSTPIPCPAISSVTDQFCITNVGAAAENPYSSLIGCQGPDMPSPAADVWYSFVATSTDGFVTDFTLGRKNLVPNETMKRDFVLG